MTSDSAKALKMTNASCKVDVLLCFVLQKQTKKQTNKQKQTPNKFLVEWCIALSNNHSKRCRVRHVCQQLGGEPRVSLLVGALMLSGRRRKQHPGQRQEAQPPPGSAEPAVTRHPAPRTHRGQPGYLQRTGSSAPRPSLPPR